MMSAKNYRKAYNDSRLLNWVKKHLNFVFIEEFPIKLHEHGTGEEEAKKKKLG
jgi:hypothetical protein